MGIQEVLALCDSRDASNPYYEDDKMNHHHPTWVLVSDVRNAALKETNGESNPSS